MPSGSMTDDGNVDPYGYRTAAAAESRSGHRSAVVFVHGFLSSAMTWQPLISLFNADKDVFARYALLPFEYDSPKFRLRPDRRIPNLAMLADSLSTFIDTKCAGYEQLVLVGHSQGGLVIQGYLAKMITNRRGRDLSKINTVILLACPNSGAQIGFLLRRATGWLWRNPQERQLRPLDEPVAEIKRIVSKHIVYADEVSPESCPVKFIVYAAESDNIVTHASASSDFPNVGALPGDHNSILRTGSDQDRTYIAIRANLLSVKTTTDYPLPRPASLNPGNIGTDLLMRVTTTRIMGTITESQSIDIFDRELADSWPRRTMDQEADPNA